MADRFCANCGNELRQADRFCPNCGQPTHETAQVPTPEADVPVPPPNNTAQPSAGGSVRGGFFGCFGVLLAVLVVLVVLAAWALEGPDFALVVLVVGYLCVMLARWATGRGGPPWKW
jgi:hypothetical protein